ncbi:cadherin-23-like [Pomacea canaliculata]|uniref:cadherin-23-like n=1 Tax=Pomacea canaliculata TaxID=400727 RepID=UPI000D73DE90|nr:cadherin-23-like [Pomacea canaliculata]XP_025085488.1 cadherin-23-like [Pomacea canaliculata]
MMTEAQDADDGYRSTFTINQYDGTITLINALDYEKHTFYQFKVNAQDGDGLKAVPADFFVTVLDVQDTPPIFINLPYAQRVFENITAGTQVIQVAGIDQDRGIPNALSYSFIKGDYSKFAINSSTGWITLGPGQILDRDSADMSSNGGVFAMYVQATEIVPAGQMNYGTTTANALVTVTVADINDNAPVFSSSQYTARIMENMQVGCRSPSCRLATS